jgi:hypothetical protein
MPAGVPKFQLPLHGQQRYIIQFASLLNLPGDMQIKLYTVLLIANFVVGTCPHKLGRWNNPEDNVYVCVCLCVCACTACMHRQYSFGPVDWEFW